MPARKTAGRARGRPRAFHDRTEANTIQSLDRSMTVLKTVAGGDGLSLTEIADASGHPAPTVYRMLTTMQTHGIVEFEDATQLWHVGVAAFRIGSAFLGRSSVVEQSRATMQRLMASTGETANLAIVDKGAVVFVSQVETHQPIRAFFAPGTIGPVHASGIGKALLAHFPDDQVAAILEARPLAGFTDSTIRTAAALKAELARIRARGWSVDDEEHTRGMRCIAAPIFNLHGEAVAGLSVSGPAVRVSPDRDGDLGPRIRAAADDVTRAIGGKTPAGPQTT